MDLPLVVEALTRRYGSRTALDDFSLEVRPGEVVGLLGPNGAGKTTLLETIEGIQTPTLGAVRVFGHTPRRLPTAIRAKVGFVFQRNAIPEHITVAQLITLYARIHGDTATLRRTAQRLGLSHLHARTTSELSVGQRQRVSVFAALAGAPSLVLMDEPTSALDLRSRRAVWDTLKEGKQERSLAGLIATHDMEEAEALCDRVLFIEDGRLRGTLSMNEATNAPCATVTVTFHAPASFVHASAISQATTDHPTEPLPRWRAQCAKDELPAFLVTLLGAERTYGFDARLGVDPQQIESAYLMHVQKAD